MTPRPTTGSKWSWIHTWTQRFFSSLSRMRISVYWHTRLCNRSISQEQRRSMSRNKFKEVSCSWHTILLVIWALHESFIAKRWHGVWMETPELTAQGWRKKLLGAASKPQPPVDRRFRPVPPGFYCSKQWQPPGTRQNRRSTGGWVLKPPLSVRVWIQFYVLSYTWGSNSCHKIYSGTISFT